MSWFGEGYNKAIIKGRELREENIKRSGHKVVITVEKSDGKKLTLNTHGIRGHVYVDDYDEERIRRFLGHNLGPIRTALKHGQRYSDSTERIRFDFISPQRSVSRSPKRSTKYHYNIFGQRIG